MSEPNAIRTAVPVLDSQNTHRFLRASSELKVLLMGGIHGNAVRVLRKGIDGTLRARIVAR